MAFDDTYIINEALIQIGEKTIPGRGEESKPQRLAEHNYAGTVEEVFALRIDYRFATARAELAQQDATPISGYDYMYKIPNGCARILAMINESGDEIEYEYRREVYLYTDSNNKQQEDDVILTNNSTCFIKYIVVRTNVARWKPWFRKLVYLTLAAKLCVPLKEGDYRKLSIKKDLEDAIADAREANNAEDANVDGHGRNQMHGNNDVVESVTGGIALRNQQEEDITLTQW